MGVDTERLVGIRARISALMADLAGELPRELASDRIRSGLSLAVATGQAGFFEARVSGAAREAFRGVCAEIQALPRAESVFVSHAARLAGTGPGTVRRWVRGGPHPYVMPEALKAFDRALSMILGETPADAAFREFFVLANALVPAAVGAHYGEAWADEGPGAGPVEEREREACRLRDEVVARFPGLDPRHLRLMEDRLRRYRPLTFSPDMAPVGHENTPEERARIERINEESRAEAESYRSGRVTVSGIVAALAKAGPRDMSRLAGPLAHASDLHYGDDRPLLAFETDESGAIRDITSPGEETRTLQ